MSLVSHSASFAGTTCKQFRKWPQDRVKLGKVKYEISKMAAASQKDKSTLTKNLSLCFAAVNFFFENSKKNFQGLAKLENYFQCQISLLK